MTSKKELGQFMTTRHSYILGNFTIPSDVIVVEPFVGHGDLIEYIRTQHPSCVIEYYDIDPKIDGTIEQDTLLTPPEYTGKYVITNPPYLARNKTKKYQDIFERYHTNDLYKCFIQQLCDDKPIGGILIVPLNFWSSIRRNDITLRKSFLTMFSITQLNIFEEQVFADTTYTICSFQFKIKTCTAITSSFKALIFPSKSELDIALNADNNFIIGGDIYHLPLQHSYKISRLTSNNKTSSARTNLLVKCVDDSFTRQICLSVVDDSDVYVDETSNLSSRTYATLVIEPTISLDTQCIVAQQFNEFLSLRRHKYNSLFLANYRESKDIARKRISFDLVYTIVGYILEQI